MFKKKETKSKKISYLTRDEDHMGESQEVNPIVESKIKPIVSHGVKDFKVIDGAQLSKLVTFQSVEGLSNKNDAFRENEENTDVSNDIMAQRLRQIEKSKLVQEGKSDSKVFTGASETTLFLNKSERDIARAKFTGSLGPLRAPTNVRLSCRFDYAMGICKDWKETGYCGYGDSCIFMHDRGDYKTGWELEQEWEEEKRRELLAKQGLLENDEESDYEVKEEDNDICQICNGEVSNAVQLLCKHVFCEECALQRMKKSNKCKECGKDSKGIMNPFTKKAEKKAEKKVIDASKLNSWTYREGIDHY